MRKIWLVISLLFYSLTCFSQVPKLKWQKCFGGNGDEYSWYKGISIAYDGNYFVAGTANDTISNGDVPKVKGQYDYYILKIDTAGSIIWKKCYGGQSDEVILGVLATKDNGCIVVGSARSIEGDVPNIHNSLEVWVLKLDSAGNKEWSRCYGGSGFETGYAIQSSADGGYFIVAGATSSDFDVPLNKGKNDVWIFKIDSIGSILWNKTFGGSEDDVPFSIFATKDNGCVVGIRSSSNDGDFPGNKGLPKTDDYVILKLDKDGNPSWSKRYGSKYDDLIYSIKQARDGGYIVAGTADTTSVDVSGNFGSSDCWIVKLDSTGTKIWDKNYGGSLQDEAYDIVQDKDGGYLVSGTTYSQDGQVTGQHGSTQQDVWVYKIDNVGKLIWQKTYGGTQQDIGSCIAIASNAEILVSGHTSTNNDGDITNNHGGTPDLWVLKLQCALPSIPTITANVGSLVSSSTTGNQWYRNGQLISGATSQVYNPAGIGGTYKVIVTNGCGSATSAPLIVTGIDNVSLHPVSVSVSPNPFGEATTVRYNLPTSAKKAVLKIYNIQGGLAKSVTLDVTGKQVTVSADDLVNGVYMYDIETDGVITAAKGRMVVIK